VANGARDTGWFKSSYSGGGDDSCVEVRIAETDTGWFKSSHSGGGNDQCVECRLAGTAVGVRDSKNPAAGEFWIPASAWAAFVASTVR
jgi:hypothetical protein